MKKEFIPYEQALALKRLGYNEKGLAFYTENTYGDGQELQWFRKPNDCNNDYVFISAPTFSQAFRWFREKYELMSEIIWTSALPTHNTFTAIIKSEEKIVKMTECDIYEEAELECLKKLIEIVKDEKK